MNSISPELQYIRQSIVPSLLDKTYGNIRAGHEKFAIFEMNQVYPRNNGVDEDGVPQSGYQLGFVYADSSVKSNYYTAKKYLETLLDALGVKYSVEPFRATDENTYYEPKRSAIIKSHDQILGYLGEIKLGMLRAFKLAQGTAAFELDLALVLRFAEGASHKDFRISQYPSVSRDVTLTVSLDTPYAELDQQIHEALAAKNLIFKVACTSIYQAEGASSKNVSFHIEFADPDKTLEKAEIQAIMKQLESIK